ncbi:hypothetical protein D3C80_1504470 [compost metagenome]
MVHDRIQLAANLIIQLRDVVVNQGSVQLFDPGARLAQALQKDLHPGSQTLVCRGIGHCLVILPDIQRTQLRDRTQIDFFKQGSIHAARFRTLQHHALTASGILIFYRHQHFLFVNPLNIATVMLASVPEQTAHYAVQR